MLTEFRTLVFIGGFTEFLLPALKIGGRVFLSQERNHD
jgi:hypothetical protein